MCVYQGPDEMPREILRFAYFFDQVLWAITIGGMVCKQKEADPQDQEKANASGQANSKEGLIPEKETFET